MGQHTIFQFSLTKWLQLSLVIFSLLFHCGSQLQANSSTCATKDKYSEFNQCFMGVGFQPFVKKYNIHKGISFKMAYTFENVKTMLTVVSNKFTKILVSGFHGFLGGPYSYNLTYNHGSFASVYAGEAAAQINRERGIKALSLMYFASLRLTQMQTTKEVLLAMEAAEKANQIYRGTVTGICFHGYTFPELQYASHLIQVYRNRALQLDLQIGLSLNCDDVASPKNNTIYEIQRQIITQVNIIICDAPVVSYDIGFEAIGEQLLQHRNVIRQIKANSKVMALLALSDCGENLSIFWNAVNKWAEQNSYAVYIYEAFDNPWKSMHTFKLGECGWWKLTADSKVNSIDGYVEKIYEKHTESATVPTFIPQTTEGPKIMHKEFEREYTGVSFSPHVTYPNVTKTMLGDTRKNIAAMLSVISGKFRKVLVDNVYSTHGQYIYNFTYHRGTGINIYSGEEAALINLKTGKQTLALMYEVVFPTTDRKSEIGILLALEAAEKANKIFGHTVEGISIAQRSTDTTLLSRGEILQLIRNHRKKATQLGVKLGVDINWGQLINPENEAELSIQQQILSESDFVIFHVEPGNWSLGPIPCLQIMTDTLLFLRFYVHKVNPNSEVITTLLWPSSGVEKWESIENMAVFWHTASNWALENKYTLYLGEAFDTYTRVGSDLGWWKLTDGSKIDSIDGYVEKVLGEKMKQDKHIPSTNAEYVYIPLSVVGISVVIFAIIIAFYFSRRPTTTTVLSTEETHQFFYGSTKKSLQCDASAYDNALSAPYRSSLEISKDKIQIDWFSVLGSGECGSVYRAKIEVNKDEDMEVALKVARHKTDATALKGLLTEIKIMTYLGTHQNIVELIGAYTGELSLGIVYVATELCALGSLESYLRKKARDTDEENGHFDAMHEFEMVQITASHISFVDMVRWSNEIACGMEFLEEKCVVHADLATRNVLLTSEKTAKITDFGLSRRMNACTDVVKDKKRPLPWQWMAIETLKQMDFSTKSDVWSYGVTMWEIFSKGRTPYPGRTWDQDFVCELENGLRLKSPPLATPEICQLMSQCWSLDPKERPGFSDLVSDTKRLYQNYYGHDEKGVSLYTFLREDDE